MAYSLAFHTQNTLTCLGFHTWVFEFVDDRMGFCLTGFKQALKYSCHI
jgi:hypothetical protein